MEKETDEKGNPLTYWGGIKNNDTTEEQLLQEARIEAEKVYPFIKGDDFSKGFNSEIVKINLDLLHKQKLFIEGYIANAKKQMSEAVELNDIIKCIVDFDDAETDEIKGRHFSTIQRDLMNLKQQKQK